MTPFVAGQNVELKYVFYENYVDQCHPNNPNCVTGVTCSNCDDGFNPQLDVACNLVVFSENPLLVGVDNRKSTVSNVSVRPNPTDGVVEVYVYGSSANTPGPVVMYNMTGLQVDAFEWNGKQVQIDLSGHASGMYFLKIRTGDRTEMKKVILR